MTAQETFASAMKLEKAYDFEAAKKIYADLAQNVQDSVILEKTRSRLEDMDDLIAEKGVYERIDENARRVLSEIGLNISDYQVLMDLLMEADAIDFESESAVFIPIKREYIDRCIDQCPREWPGDPGMNTFGTGATPPFLKRPGSDDLRQASRMNLKRSPGQWGKIRMLSASSACRWPRIKAFPPSRWPRRWKNIILASK